MPRGKRNDGQPRAPRKPRTKSNVPGAAGVAGVGDNGKPKHNLSPEDTRALFLHHRVSWNELQAKQKALDTIAIGVKAALKKDGFTVKQMEIADSLADLKGEAKIQGEVKDRLQVARWIGHPLGAQLDLFADVKVPEMTVDRAYDLGKLASMENRPAKPQDHGLAPDSENHNAYMNGYHDHQRELAGGLKAPGAHAHDTATEGTTTEPPTAH